MHWQALRSKQAKISSVKNIPFSTSCSLQLSSDVHVYSHFYRRLKFAVKPHCSYPLIAWGVRRENLSWAAFRRWSEIDSQLPANRLVWALPLWRWGEPPRPASSLAELRSSQPAACHPGSLEHLGGTTHESHFCTLWNSDVDSNWQWFH